MTGRCRMSERATPSAEFARVTEVTWRALHALIEANPGHPSYVGADIGNLRLPDGTYYATRSAR